MTALNMYAVLAAAIAAFLAAGAYYASIGRQLSKHSRAPAAMPPALIAFEITKHLLVSGVIAGVVSGLGITTSATAVLFAAGLWIAFPVVLLAGSVLHEKVPWQLAAIHAGDWLVKLLLIVLIVALWP